MNIYFLSTYRDVIRETMNSLKETAPKNFTFQDMAISCRMQKTYISRVLGGNADFSDDQIYMISEYLNFNDDQRNYLTLLHACERTSLKKRRQEIQKKIANIQAKHRRSEKHISAQELTVNPIDAMAYHLNPEMILVHVFLTIQRFAAQPKLIAEQLGVSVMTLTSILAKLESLGLIEKDGKEFRVKVDSLHLSNTSPVYKVYSLLQRHKASERIRLLPEDQAYAFSATFSANQKVQASIKEKFLELLKDIQPQVLNSEADQVFQLNFDLFPWSV